MKQKTILFAAIFGATAVGLGAFGAHAFKDLLEETGRLATFETATKYHFYHAIVLLFVGLWMDEENNKRLKIAAYLFTFGILLFSGSLYILCLTNTPAWGAVTPIGGVLFIIGWVMIGFQAIKKPV